MFPLLMSLTNGGPGHASENICLVHLQRGVQEPPDGIRFGIWRLYLTIVMAVIAGLQMRLTREDDRMAEERNVRIGFLPVDALVDLRCDVPSDGFCNHEFL